MDRPNIFRNERKSLVLLSIILLFYICIKMIDLKYRNIIVLLFWMLFFVYNVFEKNVRVHSKLKNKEFYIIFMFVAASIYIVTYFSFGIIDGFGINIYDTSFIGVARNVITLGTVLVLREFIRSYLINSVQKRLAIYFGILIVIVFSFTEINLGALFEQNTLEDLLAYLSQNVLPIILSNSLLTFSSYIAGPIGSMIYSLITNIPIWVIGVVPNFRWITILLIGSLFPLLCIIVMKNVSKHKEMLGKKREQKEENPYSWIVIAVVMVGLSWFSLGIFPIFPSIIVSNSMKPMISKGDMVFIKKEDTSDVSEGDIVQYRLDDIQVVHRIVDEKYDEGVRYFITKGDNNNTIDPSNVYEQQIMGRYMGKVPYIGWFSLIFKQEKSETRIETGKDETSSSKDDQEEIGFLFPRFFDK